MSTEPAEGGARDEASSGSTAFVVPSPPALRDDLPAVRVRPSDGPPLLRAHVDDFEVEEVRAYEPSDDGEHHWLWIEKRGVGTLQFVDRLAEAAGVPSRAVGYAGLKDAHAVTRQALTLPPEAGPVSDEWFESQGARVLERRPTRKKLKIGHLRGNRFAVVVRGEGGFTEDAAAAVRTNLEFLSVHGCPDGFGEQRFGGGGANLARGLRVLTADDVRKAVKRVRPSIVRLWLTSVQSEVFTRALADRISRWGAGSLAELRTGDIAWLHKNGACFPVGDPEAARRESERCETFELSPSGPMPGPRMLAASGEVGEIEAAALASLGLEPSAFDGLGMRLTQGVRRPLRVPVGGPAVERLDDGALRLAFTLPRGAYATVVVRQLVDGLGWFDPPPTVTRPA